MRCVCLLKSQPEYRRGAFLAGLRANGHEVAEAIPRVLGKDDALLIWNRYGQSDQLAKRYETAGGVVLVAENGYLGREWSGSHWYALARGAHNGAGHAPDQPARLERHPVVVRPWRTDGGRIVVLAQRGIGQRGVAQPRGWADQAAQALRRRTRREVIIRRHPGEAGRNEPLDEVLGGAWACVTWGSGAGIKALVAGVPVFCGLGLWVGSPAARPLEADLEAPFVGDRTPMLRRVMSSMWRTDEIASGEAFAALLA